MTTEMTRRWIRVTNARYVARLIGVSYYGAGKLRYANAY
jgi:hypothetical protein